MPLRQHTADISAVIDHLQQMADWFNSHSREHDLGTTLNPARILSNLEHAGPIHTATMISAYSHSRVTEQQVSVAVEAIANSNKNLSRSGLIVSPHDQESIGTAMMLMFAAPIRFLTSGIRSAPLYVTRNSHAQLRMAQNHIKGFIRLYGDIWIEGGAPLTSIDTQGPLPHGREFDLVTYMDGLLEADRYPGGDLLEEIAILATARRLPGGLDRVLKAIGDRASKRDQELMTILVDSLFSARRSTDSVHSSSRLIGRALKEIEAEFLDEATPGIVIGVASEAVPGHTSSSIWTVQQGCPTPYEQDLFP